MMLAFYNPQNSWVAFHPLETAKITSSFQTAHMSLQRHVAVVLCHTGQDVAKILPQTAQAEQKPSFCELTNDKGGWFFTSTPLKTNE